MNTNYHICQPKKSHPNQHALSQVIDAKLDEFLDSNPKLPHYKKTKLQNLQRCYRREFGYVVYQCGSCKVAHFMPATCGSTICPKCSFNRRQNWLSNRKDSLPPVSFFHTVFTVAHELNTFFLENQELAFTALFKAVEKTIKEVIEKKGGPGSEGLFTLVLHTWNRELLPHFHIHGLVGAGYLKDGVWHDTDPKYFANFEELSKNFKKNLETELLDFAESGEVKKIAKYEKHIKHVTEHGCPPTSRSGNVKPQPPEPIYPIAESGLKDLKDILNKIADKPFKVFAEHVEGGSEKVLEYLTAYTYKIGLSDSRLELNHENQTVEIKIKKNREKGRPALGPKKVTLSFEQFLRRYIIHILPKGFRRIRHYGVLQGPKSKEKLKQILVSLENKNKITKEDPVYAKIVLEQITSDIDSTVSIPCQACENGTLDHLLTYRKKGFSFDSLVNNVLVVEMILKDLDLIDFSLTPMPVANAPPAITEIGNL